MRSKATLAGLDVFVGFAKAAGGRSGLTTLSQAGGNGLTAFEVMWRSDEWAMTTVANYDNQKIGRTRCGFGVGQELPSQFEREIL